MLTLIYDLLPENEGSSKPFVFLRFLFYSRSLNVFFPSFALPASLIQLILGQSPH